ncbi:MAG: TolC family outer membrane protein [Alphaproteobacteria bacterium]|nr:TolC family outer membrane protein [Alphaproteobacteria bacterium]
MKNTKMKLISTVILALLLSNNAMAETIFEAMTDAYNTNPTLHRQRAVSGATNEDAALARSGFRPTVAVGANYTDSHTRNTGNPTVDGYSKGYRGTVKQSVFSGFQTYNAVKAADNNAKAGIDNLYEVEQQILLAASSAYLDVVRDEAIVELQKNNEKLLKKQLDETMARFDVGEVTRTDVAQSRASYAQAQSDLISAEGNLAISRENYMQIVGKEAENVAFPENLQNLFPQQFADAMDYAKANNYALHAAKKSLKAAKYGVKSQEGALLPEVSFTASTGKTQVGSHNLPKDPATTSTEYVMEVSMPLYAGGATRANIRKSKYQRWQADEGLREAERAVVANVTDNWELMQTSKSNISSIKEQVKASAIALEGTQKEEALGNRTVLDVLNAYQTLLASQVSEVTARHDYYLSGLQLLQTMGKLTAKQLNLNVKYYNAEQHYQDTKGKWLSLSIDKD